MSTLKTINIMHPNGNSNTNIVLSSNGSLVVANSLAVLSNVTVSKSILIGTSTSPDTRAKLFVQDATSSAVISGFQADVARMDIVGFSSTASSYGSWNASEIGLYTNYPLHFLVENGSPIKFSTRVSGTGGGTERMRIDNNGYVTIPNQPMCSVYHTSVTTYTNPTYITFVASYDPLSMYNASTKTITVPKAGRYLITVDLLLSESSAYALDAYLVVNSGAVKRIYSSTGHGYQNAVTSVIKNLSAGDYIYVQPTGTCTIFGDTYCGGGINVTLLG